MSRFTVEDPNIFQLFKVSGHHLHVPRFHYFKVLLGEFEDVVVSVNYRPIVDLVALSIDA